MKNRIQRLPKCFWGVNQTTRTPMVFWFDHNSTAEQPNHYKKCASAEEAWLLTAKAAVNNIAMMAVAYVEEDQQAEVISFSEVGKFEWLARSTSEKSKEYRASIERARNLVFKNELPSFQIIGKKPEPVKQIVFAGPKTIPENNKLSWIVGVVFDHDSEVYRYRVSRQHETNVESKDSYVMVYSRKEKENVIVPIVECGQMKESDILELAKSLGYADLKQVVKEDLTDDEFENWTLCNYKEPSEDFEAMKAAYGLGWEKDF